MVYIVHERERLESLCRRKERGLERDLEKWQILPLLEGGELPFIVQVRVDKVAWFSLIWGPCMAVTDQSLLGYHLIRLYLAVIDLGVLLRLAWCRQKPQVRPV